MKKLKYKSLILCSKILGSVISSLMDLNIVVAGKIDNLSKPDDQTSFADFVKEVEKENKND